MRLRRSSLAALATLAAALLIPTAASATTIGSTHLQQASGSSDYCGGNPSCTFTQTTLPGAVTKAPFSARIRQWKLKVATPGSFRFVVLKKRSGGKFKTVAASAKKNPGSPGVKSYDTNLSIHRKNFIGINLLDAAVAIGGVSKPGAYDDGFLPALMVGDSDTPNTGYSGPDLELQLNATLKH
jgi:hypothetical protein